MSYTAMYRKFRPDQFSDVKGQDHIVTTLKNQIKNDRIGHAYLFCGTRGTGKTTIAKIFAKAVNCSNPIDGSPCNECPTCKAIAAGASMNVIEIDAASNNGVDNIREIRDEVQYSPTEGRFKVYIIDEVHMLSIGAFNALLKTLEEPPSYVIFILATTEAHKIPVTILSRCQRYDFKRITIETISERLRELTAIEGIDVEEKAIRYIAKSADGAMRDALSLLDQCVAFYMGETLKYDNVLEVLGAVDTSVFSQMLRLVVAGDTMGCIHKLEEIIMQGRDLTQFITDFTWYLRNLMIVKTSEDAAEMIDMSTERIEALKEEAQMTDIDSIMRYIRILSEVAGQIKYAVGKRVLVEIALIKLTKPAMETDLTSVLSRLSILEEKIESGAAGVDPAMLSQMMAMAGGSSPKGQAVGMDLGVQSSRKPLDIAIPEDVQKVADEWYKVEGMLTDLLRGHLKTTRLAPGGDNKLVIVAKDDGLSYKTLSRQETIETIENAIGEVTGKAVKVEVKALDTGEVFADNYVEIKKRINIQIEEEDF